MKIPFVPLMAAATLVLSGCGQLDLAPEGNPNRILTGTVDVGSPLALPGDAVVTVLIQKPAEPGQPAVPLNSETIRNPGSAPVPFRLEYRAEDEDLRQGLNVVARISYGGKVRYFNQSAHAVTLSNANDPQRISVVRIGP